MKVIGVICSGRPESASGGVVREFLRGAGAGGPSDGDGGTDR